MLLNRALAIITLSPSWPIVQVLPGHTQQLEAHKTFIRIVGGHFQRSIVWAASGRLEGDRDHTRLAGRKSRAIISLAERYPIYEDGGNCQVRIPFVEHRDRPG